MKNLIHFKEEVARENGCRSWRKMLTSHNKYDLDSFADNAALRYGEYLREVGMRDAMAIAKEIFIVSPPKP